MKAIIYRRVSSDEQVDTRNGLESQKHICEAWAGSRKIEIGGIFGDEGVSGAAGLDKRPGLLEAISNLSKDDVLLVSNRDRLGRDPLLMAMIEASTKRKKCRIVSVAGQGTEGESPTDILTRRIADAFSEYERLIIKARTKAAMQAKKRRGERVSHWIPFGQDLAQDQKTLVPNAQEQEAVALVRSLRVQGLSLRAVAAELTARRIPTKRGGKWEAATVKFIIERSIQG